MSVLALTRLQNFFGEKVRVDDADDTALFVDDRKREKFVEHKKLARLEDGGSRGNSHDTRHDDLSQRCFKRCAQQTPRGHHTNESSLLIDGIKVNDAFAHALAPDALQRFSYGH